MDLRTDRLPIPERAAQIAAGRRTTAHTVEKALRKSVGSTNGSRSPRAAASLRASRAGNDDVVGEFHLVPGGF
jgi:hypothetical protein